MPCNQDVNSGNMQCLAQERRLALKPEEPFDRRFYSIAFARISEVDADPCHRSIALDDALGADAASEIYALGDEAVSDGTLFE